MISFRGKRIFLVLAALFALSGQARAIELPQELRDAFPEEAALAEESDWAGGLRELGEEAAEKVRSELFSGARSALVLMVGVLLLGTARTMSADKSGSVERCVDLVGVLWVTAVSSAQMESLIGMGLDTVHSIAGFAKLLLPALGSAAAAGGGIAGASLRQVGTVFFSDILLTLIDSLLVPMVYLYVGLAAAQAVLEEGLFTSLANMLRKLTIWLLSGLLVLFTGYLAVGGAISGAADATAVRAAKTAVSTAVPLVGKILAEASETILAGAGVLRGTIGVFGVLVILGICLLPVIRLGVQYLLYRLVGIAASVSGPGAIARLLSMLGDAFAMVLAMTASSAVLLIISILSTLTAVTP